jgi:hypothetical protein
LDLRKVYINFKRNERWSPSGLGYVSAIYINDLPINIQRVRTTLFADDTNIQIEATKANILNETIKKLCNSYQDGVT